MRIVAALVLQAVVFAAVGCLTVSNLEHVPTPAPVPPDRQDCGEILGTAFRSSAEQAWFTENCSAWAATTLGRVEIPIQPTGQQPDGSRNSRANDLNLQDRDGEDDDERNRDDRDRDRPQDEDDVRRCDQLRGRPYQQPGDREWFLQNCLNRTDGDREDEQDDGQDRNDQLEANQTEDLDCGRLAGRPYESPQQRDWYLANCLNQGPATAGGASQGAVGPDGRPCSAIYGTRFQSPSERNWFNQNCPH
jgi:hypothetical protein